MPDSTPQAHQDFVLEYSVPEGERRSTRAIAWTIVALYSVCVLGFVREPTSFAVGLGVFAALAAAFLFWRSSAKAAPSRVRIRMSRVALSWETMNRAGETVSTEDIPFVELTRYSESSDLPVVSCFAMKDGSLISEMLFIEPHRDAFLAALARLAPSVDRPRV